MQVLHTLDVQGPTRRAQIALVHGNLLDVGATKVVDVLVVSTVAEDFAPTLGSLEGALQHRRIDFADLARSKSVDLTAVHGGWLSRDIRGIGSSVNAKRILCMEQPDAARMMRMLVAVLADAREPATVALPVIGAGEQGVDFDAVVLGLLQAATEWIAVGLPIGRLEIVVATTQRAARAAQLFDDFAALRRATTLVHPARTKRAAFGVFVSHAPQDATAARALALALEAQGQKVLLEAHALQHGTIWQQQIHDNLQRCARVAALFSPHYLASPACLEELHHALVRRRGDHAEPFVPVLIESVELPAYMQLVPALDAREHDPSDFARAARAIVGTAGAPRHDAHGA